MKLKPMLRAGLDSSWKSICIFYGIEIFTVLVSKLVNSMGSDFHILSGGNSAFISVIYFFVFGLVIFKEIFFVALANGVSRRTTFLATGVLCAAMAVFASVVDNILNALFADSNVFSFDFYTMMYGAEGNPFLIILMKFLISACIALFALAAGYMLGGIFYRLGKVGRVLLSVSLPVGLFFLLPIILSVIPEGAQQSLMNFFTGFGGFIVRSPWNFVLVLLGLFILFGFCGWLTLRRAPIKA